MASMESIWIGNTQLAEEKQNNINRPEDKQNYTLLLQKIRETFDAQSTKDGKKYLLTIASGAGKWHVDNMELNLIQQYVDYIQLMTYDIHGSWEPLAGFECVFVSRSRFGL